MRSARLVTVSFILMTALSGSWQSAAAQGSSDLAGGWIVTSWTSPDGGVNSEPQRGLFLFTTTGQYSIMYVPGDEVRAVFPEGGSPTDEQTVAAYGQFVANSGRYTVDGNRLTYEAYVAKNPNYMADWNAAEPENGNGIDVTFSIDDGILTLTWVGGNSAGQKATFRRPGEPAND